MSRAVRFAVGLLVCVGLVCGCGGPSSSDAAPTTVKTSARPLPKPAGPACAGQADVSDLSLVDALTKLTGTANFSVYLTADKARTKKYAALSGVTAFVPVDSAWQTLDPATAEKLADPAQQAALVEYALVPMLVLPEDFSGKTTAAMATFRDQTATLSGQGAPDQIVLNGTAHVVCSAIPFDGGLIYLTDTLLLAPS